MKRIISVVIAVYVGVFYSFAAPTSLVPIGKTAGIKILCDGVMVSGVTKIDTANGPKYPAQEAKLMQGDIIKEINGVKVYTNEELAAEIYENGENKANIVFERNGEIQNGQITPVLDKNDMIAKIGIWVRDSMAGIGTITYIDPETNEYAALGHSISEMDSGKIMPIKQGELVQSSVTEVKKGKAGEPGELRGDFNVSEELGSVNINTNTGIYGYMDDEDLTKNLKAYEVGKLSEVTKGEAYILSNIEGQTVEQYTVEIKKISDDDDKNFIIEVTDPRLLDKTGGIVQGMSGSPILQNGKLIGAVTHVLVNNPTEGYGISIENMLETAEQTTK